MSLQVDRREMQIRGTVLLTLADTLAAHQLEGFEVDVGFALRKCRVCLATWEDIQSKVCRAHAPDDMHSSIYYQILPPYSPLRRASGLETQQTMTNFWKDPMVQQI